MCLNPTIIPNPSYRAILSDSPFSLSAIKDKTSFAFLKVGCGHCVECQGVKQSYYAQRASLMSQTHYVFYQTLTLNKRHLKFVDVNGYKNAYFDITYFQNYLKQIRKYNVLHSDFKYIAVTEYGGQYHRPHMHIQYFVPKTSPYWQKFTDMCNTSIRNAALSAVARNLFSQMLFYWRSNSGSTRNPVYDNILDFCSKYGRRNYDFTYVPESDITKVTYYISKYMLKYDDWITKKQQAFKLNLSPSEYKVKWALVKPRVLVSKHFGDSPVFTSYIRKCIDMSIKDSPVNPRLYFYDSIGHRSALSPYLRRAHVSVSQSLDCFFRSCEDISSYCNDINGQEYKHRKRHADRIVDFLKTRSIFNDPYERDIFQDQDILVETS